jgi:hypothetical protein
VADQVPSAPEPEPTDAEVEAFAAAWEAARQAIGPEGAPAGTKTRAGLRAAFAERQRAYWEAHKPCLAELHSWDYFRPEQMDSYYMRCDRLGPHAQHVNSDTGATWPSVVIL